MEKKVIGYQGVAGAYSQAAMHQFIASRNWSFDQIIEKNYDDFPSLAQDLLDGVLDYAVMPVENSTTGLITRSLDLFRGQQMIAIQEFYQTIEHSLWTLPGTKIEDLREVYSHPEALLQCEQFFRDHPHIKPVAFPDTAQAAQFVRENQNPTIGAIASPLAGSLYGLTALKEKIQTEETNTTRFFVAHRFEAIGEQMGLTFEEWQSRHPERTQMMIFVETSHKPGALAKLLNIFHALDCNLVALDSRPILNEPFKYGFFIEVDLSTTGLDLAVLWQSLVYASESIQLIAAIEPVAFNRTKEQAHDIL